MCVFCHLEAYQVAYGNIGDAFAQPILPRLRAVASEERWQELQKTLMGAAVMDRTDEEVNQVYNLLNPRRVRDLPYTSHFWSR